MRMQKPLRHFNGHSLALLETAPLAASQHEWRRERIAHLHELVGDILALTGRDKRRL